MSTLRVDNLQGQTADGTNRYVVQVVSTTKTDTFSANSAQIQAVTGLSVSITPSNTNNKVFIMADVNASVDNAARGYLALYKDGSVLVQGDASGSRIQAATQLAGADSGQSLSSTVSFLDSPNTTSAVTYQIYLVGESSSTQVHVNRSHNDADAAGRGRFISTITAMEIAQ